MLQDVTEAAVPHLQIKQRVLFAGKYNTKHFANNDLVREQRRAVSMEQRLMDRFAVKRARKAEKLGSVLQKSEQLKEHKKYLINSMDKIMQQIEELE